MRKEKALCVIDARKSMTYICGYGLRRNECVHAPDPDVAV